KGPRGEGGADRVGAARRGGRARGRGLPRAPQPGDRDRRDGERDALVGGSGRERLARRSLCHERKGGTVTDVAARPVHTESPPVGSPATRPGPPMRYLVYLEPEPTLDWYRLDDAPRENLAPVFLCPYAVVTGESGAMYNLM